MYLNILTEKNVFVWSHNTMLLVKSLIKAPIMDLEDSRGQDAEGDREHPGKKMKNWTGHSLVPPTHEVDTE